MKHLKEVNLKAYHAAQESCKRIDAEIERRTCSDAFIIGQYIIDDIEKIIDSGQKMPGYDVNIESSAKNHESVS